jgi:hypothetical protein
MFGGRDRPEEVTCIACGETIRRTEAREYDKHGDRFDRRGKEFEHLCKPCYRDLCHQPRGDLEAVLVESDAGATDREAFLRQYADLATEGETERERNER